MSEQKLPDGARAECSSCGGEVRFVSRKDAADFWRHAPDLPECPDHPPVPTRAADIERVRLEGIELRLCELIDRHAVENYGEVPVKVAELRNVLLPGSAPMYPDEPGWVATCSICMPEGDGIHTRRGGGR